MNANNVGVSCHTRMESPNVEFVTKMVMGIMIVHKVSVLNALLLRSSMTIKPHVGRFNVLLTGQELQKIELVNHVHKVSQSTLSILQNVSEQIMLVSVHLKNHFMILIYINVQLVLMGRHLIRILINVKVKILLILRICHQISVRCKRLTITKIQELVKNVQSKGHFSM